MYYLHKDFPIKIGIGNYQAITDEQGTLKEELSFDPWGRRRNPTNWTFNDVPHSFLFNRGYTGHEHLNKFSLINPDIFHFITSSGLATSKFSLHYVWENQESANMNGRVYDPVIGRFLSPDNFVQESANSQNFNRYSYCLNNPLVYTDPDGEFFFIFMGAALYTSFQIANGNVNDMGDFAISMGIGLAAGAAGAWAGGAVAGAIGSSSTLPTLGGTILNGAISGSAGGFLAGFIGGSGSAWMSGCNFVKGLQAGLTGGAYGALGGAVLGGISGGIQYERQISVFQKGIENIGVNGSEQIPATDEFLSKAQQTWYKDAPMDKVKAFTVEDVPQKHLQDLINNNAPAKTVPLSFNKVFTGNSNVYFNKNLAFNSAKQLFFTMGHEFVHVSQFAYLGSIGAEVSLLRQSTFIDLLEYHAYSYQNSIGGLKFNGFSSNMVKSLYIHYPQYFQPLNYINFGWTNNANYKYPF